MAVEVDIPLEDLPLWMRRARQGVDWGILIVLLFSLALSWGFILHPGLPRTNATENYVFRAADYAQSLKEGRLYPRWSPNVLGGYGAPIPNYYPPGAAYSAAALQNLFTNDTVNAVRLLYITALCLSGLTVYVLVTRWAGAAAGVVASVLYGYSPYVGLTAPYVLGDLPGVMAFTLIPALLWSLTRLMQRDNPLDILLVAFSVAGLLLTHIQSALLGMALGGVLVLWYYQKDPKSPTRFRLRMPVFACVLGIGLASFYWIPALVEQGAVDWWPAANTSSHRLQFPDFILPVQQVDVAEMVTTPQFTLGLPAVMFTMLGALTVLLVRKNVGFQALFLVTGLILAALALQVFPDQVWLLGPIALCLAVGGSVVVHWRDLIPNQRLVAWRNNLIGRSARANWPTRQVARLVITAVHPKAWQRILLPVLLVLIVIAALPVWLSPEWPASFGPVDPAAQVRHEQQGFGIPVLPADAPIPATISKTLQPSRFLLSGYTTGIINKIPPDQISVDTQASPLAHLAYSDRFQIYITRLTTLNVLTAYFPGWEASVGSVQTSLSPDQDTGLIRVTLPPTQGSELLITLGPTPVRTAAWVVSWVTLVLLGLITVRRLRRAASQEHGDNLVLLAPQEARLLALVFLCCALVIALFTIPQFPFQLRARPGYKLDGTLALASRTDQGLEALSYQLERTVYRPGETIDFTLFWRMLRFLPENYQAQAYLWDAQNELRWHRTGLHRPGGYPTRRWMINRYISDPYTIELSETIVPGDYQIAIEVFKCNPACDSSERLVFFDRTGLPLGYVLLLPTPVTIVP